MKNLLYILLALFIFSCNNKNQDEDLKTEKAKMGSKRPLTGEALRADNCAKSAEAAEKAEKYAQKAQTADNEEEMRDYAEEAMEEFHKASKFSVKCGCNDAKILADEGYSLARKASIAVSLQAARTYAEIASNSAEDLASEANKCTLN